MQDIFPFMWLVTYLIKMLSHTKFVFEFESVSLVRYSNILATVGLQQHSENQLASKSFDKIQSYESSFKDLQSNCIAF